MSVVLEAVEEQLLQVAIGYCQLEGCRCGDGGPVHRHWVSPAPSVAPPPPPAGAVAAAGRAVSPTRVAVGIRPWSPHHALHSSLQLEAFF